MSFLILPFWCFPSGPIWKLQVPPHKKAKNFSCLCYWYAVSNDMHPMNMWRASSIKVNLLSDKLDDCDKILLICFFQSVAVSSPFSAQATSSKWSSLMMWRTIWSLWAFGQMPKSLSESWSIAFSFCFIDFRSMAFGCMEFSRWDLKALEWQVASLRFFTPSARVWDPRRGRRVPMVLLICMTRIARITRSFCRLKSMNWNSWNNGLRRKISLTCIQKARSEWLHGSKPDTSPVHLLHMYSRRTRRGPNCASKVSIVLSQHNINNQTKPRTMEDESSTVPPNASKCLHCNEAHGRFNFNRGAGSEIIGVFSNWSLARVISERCRFGFFYRHVGKAVDLDVQSGEQINQVLWGLAEFVWCRILLIVSWTERAIVSK